MNSTGDMPMLWRMTSQIRTRNYSDNRYRTRQRRLLWRTANTEFQAGPPFMERR